MVVAQLNMYAVNSQNGYELGAVLLSKLLTGYFG